MIVDGEIVNDFNEAGTTVTRPDADFPFSVAVMVAEVGATTCPACIWNCIQPALPVIGIDAGTGATLGFELLSAMGVPAGTAAVSWIATNVVAPLASGSVVNVTDTGVGGAVLTVKLFTADHAVSAAVVGDASPCAERTRQNFVPALSEVIVYG